MISIRHVYQTFGDRQILKDVSLTVRDGETMVILGASGSGKSTLLKLIIGLLRPTSGEVLVNGKDMGSLTEAELNRERRHMGFVFQYSALFDSMNVKENVAFGLRMHTKLPEEEIDRIVKEKLHLVGLDGIENLMPSSLSGGMKKRVSLARAIALEPEIILYDEPTAGLDPIRSTDISLLIRHTQKVMHATSVVVTHDLKSAQMIADRMAFLYKGSFLAIGRPEELYQSPDPRVRQFMEGLPSDPDFSKEGDAL
ncbi:ABC transporter ATP-binding protein [Dialister sp.]|uniref:ABC transporter ATP-binding protein n=1 Tax=Dialister sp. TaxID=1955814 RepID=UPI003F019DF6